MKSVPLGILLSLAVAGCERGRPAQNDKICSTPPTLEASAAAPSRQGTATGCLHRWAYRLAQDRSAHAKTVAEAAVGQCLDAIDLVAVETDSTLERQMKVYESIALGFVVQARAGNCPIP